MNICIRLQCLTKHRKTRWPKILTIYCCLPVSGLADFGFDCFYSLAYSQLQVWNVSLLIFTGLFWVFGGQPAVGWPGMALSGCTSLWWFLLLQQSSLGSFSWQSNLPRKAESHKALRGLCSGLAHDRFCCILLARES